VLISVNQCQKKTKLTTDRISKSEILNSKQIPNPNVSNPIGDVGHGFSHASTTFKEQTV